MPTDDADRRAVAVLRDVSLGDWSILIDDVAAELDDIYAVGLTEGLELTGMGISLDAVNARAVLWARDRAASLVTAIEENTRTELRATVATGLEQGWSASRLANEIAQSPAFDEDRAMMISRTEISVANNQGNLQGYRDARSSGVRVMKEWLDADADDECSDNADEGPIDLDDEFPSGDDSPPAHPNCRCSVTPYLPDEDDEEDEG